MGSINYGELAKTSAKAFEPLKPGNYTFEVTGAEVKLSTAGNVFYKLELTVEDEGPTKGKKAWTNLTLTEDNPGTFFSQLAVLGADAAYFAGFDPVDEDDEEGQDAVHDETAAFIIGSRCSAQVKVGKPYQGRPQTDVGWLKEPGTATKRNSSVPDVEDDAAPAAPRRARRSAAATEDAAPAESKPAARRSRRGSAAPDLPPGLDA